MTLQESIWIVHSHYYKVEDDGNLGALPEPPCFHVVWSSCIECVLVFKNNNNKTPTNFVWSEVRRYCFFLGVLSCISLSCSECAHTTLKGRSKLVLFVVQAGWLGPSSHLKAMQLFSSVQCSARLKLTQLCCVCKSYFFLWVCWTAWRSWGISHSAKGDIAMLFVTYVFCFFGKQSVEILG